MYVVKRCPCLNETQLKYAYFPWVSKVTVLVGKAGVRFLIRAGIFLSSAEFRDLPILWLLFGIQRPECEAVTAVEINV
jgi:hypothetical protein